MLLYFHSFLWGICLLFSLIGWGGAINRLFFPKYRVDWGQKAGWGVAFSVTVGGVLNITGLISRITILVYLGTGLLYWLFDMLKNQFSDIGPLSDYIRNYRKDKVLVITVFVVCFLILLQYAGWVSSQTFNWHDDFQAYVVFPKKMLETGSLGPDPFSTRRIVSSLGGQSFLHTFILSVLSVKNLNIIDPALAVIITIGLLLEYMRKKSIPRRTAGFILIFFLLIPPPKMNITALMIGSVLFLSLFRTLDWEGLRNSHYMANAFIIALLSSAICSLKSSFIPACGIFFIASYLFYIIGSKTKNTAIYEFLLSSILIGAFLLPWMISMYQSSGTLLYPLLGAGYHGSAYGTYLSPLDELTISRTAEILFNCFNPYIVSIILFNFILIRRRSVKIDGREAYLSSSIGAGLGAVILYIATGGNMRYAFPFVFVAVIILMILVVAGTKVEDYSRLTNQTLMFIVITVGAVIAGYNWNWNSCKYHLHYLRDLFGFMAPPLITDKEVSQYANMQYSIPEGKTVLARLEKPFLLNFERNRVFLVDYPGGASPPPGMPFFKGSEALADYLVSQSIRYVAYSYANEAGFQKKLYVKRLTARFALTRTEAQHTFDFQDNLKVLGEARERIYDDDDIFVLDLLNSKD